MTPYIERMKSELADLSQRLSKLQAFLGNPEQLKKIKREEFKLMIQQEQAMSLYKAALYNRVQYAMKKERGKANGS